MSRELLDEPIASRVEVEELKGLTKLEVTDKLQLEAVIVILGS